MTLEPDSAEAFHDLIRSTPNRFAPVRFIQDWGNSRGQGKRIGRMVRGAMSDNIRGERTYHDIFGNVPGIDDGELGKELREELNSLWLAGIPTYLKTRSAGFDHEVAMRAAYEAMGEAPTGLAFNYWIASRGDEGAV